MKIGVFYDPHNQEHFKVLKAFHVGVNLIDEADFRPLSTYTDADEFDLCVVFGVYKKAVPNSKPRGYVIRKEDDAGKDVLILEKGYIKRHKYYSAGLNGFNGQALFNNHGSPDNRFRDLNTTIKPWRMSKDGDILLIGQVPWDASVQHTNHVQWLNDTILLIKEFTDRKIRFRPHPFARNSVEIKHDVDIGVGPLSADLDYTFCVVTFNSNTGVDAVIEGVPTFCVDKGSMIYPYAAKSLNYIEEPPIWHRGKWANDLAYTQWTEDEMKEGLPWFHLKKLIEYRLKDYAECS